MRAEIIRSSHQRYAYRRSLVLLSLICFSCTSPPKDGKLEGQAFLTLENGVTLKCSGMEIAVYLENDIIEHITEQQADEERQRQIIQGFYDEAEGKLKQAREKLHRNSRDEEALAEVEMYSLDSLKLRNFPSGKDYTYDLPNPLAKTTTDADGRFSIQLPITGKYAIVAHSQRKGKRVTEHYQSIDHYYWIVRVSLDGKTSNSIMLTNNNMISSGSPDSLVKANDRYEIEEIN